jgi:toxin ParE1/3/4
MNVLWSPEALADLIALRDFIAGDSPAAARRVVAGLVSRIEELLPGNPAIGRVGRVSGTRELVVPGTPYIVPYRLREGAIEILRVYHGARRWPESF